MKTRSVVTAARAAGFLLILLLSLLPVSAEVPPARLNISQPPGGPVRLELQGESGRDYSIEASATLAPDDWTTLFTFSLTGESGQWLDPSAPYTAGTSRRFYRALTHDGPVPPAWADNFRLIDHTGKSRELNYHWTDTNVATFVLVFTATGCAAMRDYVPALTALRSQFEPRRVRFWMINSDPSDSRSNMVAEAAALGLTLPVLHDRAQVVARAYRVGRGPEAILVGRGEFPNSWHIYYRGAFDDRVNPAATPMPATGSYLATALGAYLTGDTLTLIRTPAIGCDVPLAPVMPVSYSADIAPLLQARCVGCHSPGNIAPWAMTNHDIVLIYSGGIRDAIVTGHMPPWHADPEYGHFANNNSLSAVESARLVQWIDEGAQRGEGPDPLESTPAPSLADYPFTWPAELGEPDVILTPPIQSIPANGVVDYRYYFVRPPFPSNVWLRAAIVLPSNHRVVHHISIYQGRVTDPMAESLALYVPGQRQIPYPAGTGKLMPFGDDITFELHYTPNGVAGTDLPRLGLWLHTNQHPRALLIGAPGTGPNLNISPYQQDYSIQREGAFPRDVLVYGMNPHMHLRGARMKYEVIYPDGAREILLNVPHYDFHWQTLYRLEEPKRLPAGTRLIIHGGYDNSPQNRHNPNPSATVVFGEQTTDEMFAEFLRYTELLTLRNSPRSANVVRGGRTSFSVQADSPSPPVTYQWRWNGANIPGANSASLTLTNVQPAQEGLYTVVATDPHDSVLSAPALLQVGDPPVITQPPVATNVPLGGNATFTAAVTGTPPFGYQWRKGSTTLTTIVSTATSSVFTLFNVTTNDAGFYRVALTNAFSMNPGVPSALVPLTVTVP